MTPGARVEIGSGFGCVYVVTADGLHLSQVMPYQIAQVLREELAKAQPQAEPVPEAAIREVLRISDRDHPAWREVRAWLDACPTPEVRP